MGKIFKDLNADVPGIEGIKKTTVGRDKVRRGCRWEGAWYKDVEAGGAHLIPWVMEVLLEIPGRSGTVLLCPGKQRPRAKGRK